jgi:uncharacterized heparinase superfamily protein
MARRIAMRLRGGRADRLLVAPQDIRTADPIAADHIYAGHFSMAGKTADSHGHSPFAIPAPSPAWSKALHGFGWLRHLRAADTALARANARALVEDWLSLDAHGAKPVDRRAGRDPRVATRRLISWLSQSPIVLANADHAFYGRFVGAIQAHCAALERAVAEGLDGDARLTAIIALTQAGLCLDGGGGLLRRSSLRLSRELSAQILRDGGHVSRNPRVLVELLVDLLPTRQIFVARGIAAPQALLNAVDRMTPMLRMFRHPDGSLAGFNGMSATEPDTLATLLAHGDVGAAAVLNAQYSGYQRLEAQGAVVILDAGAPPPWPFSNEAHAGCLSFEFSSGLDRIVVNCGAPQAEAADTREAARASAAHSTLIIDDHSSCRFERAGLWTVVVEGPSRVEASRRRDVGGEAIDASHDGYARRYNALHRRGLRLANDGASLSGEDCIAAAGGGVMPEAKSVAVRFHLHPAVRAARDEDGRSVLLAAPSGEEWRFEAEGRPIDLEESIFFAAPGGARPTTQIVLGGTLAEGERFGWSFTRVSPSRTPTDMASAEDSA